MPALLPCLPLAALALAASPPQAAAEGQALGMLQGQVAALHVALRETLERLEALRGEVAALREDLERAPRDETVALAAPFLASPPTGSDAVGVARAPVFEPRVEADASAVHDAVQLRVLQLEPEGARLVGELTVASEPGGVALPLARNGALYVVEWSTPQGFEFKLVLRDGASGQPAASVQVRPYGAEGRFVFVGYRVAPAP